MNCQYNESNILEKCYCLALQPGETCRHAYLVDPNRYNLDDYANQSDADYHQDLAIAAAPLPLRAYYTAVLALRALREQSAHAIWKLCKRIQHSKDVPF